MDRSGVLESVRKAFDRAAPRYDAGLAGNAPALVFRRVFVALLLRAFPPGSRLLDLGCGTGEDAVALAESGRFVHAIDVSAAMVERARAKARERGVDGSRVSFDVRAAEECDEAGAAVYDGAYADFGALNCADLARVGGALAWALRPRAPVLLSLMGRRPLPALLRRLVTGRGARRGQVTPRVAEVPVPTWYATVGEARRRLGPAFAWQSTRALGVLMPGPQHGSWAERNPQAFGVLAALESGIRGFPLLRGLGDHIVLEGVRR
jgi:SAM-dependent methyltransferase